MREARESESERRTGAASVSKAPERGGLGFFGEGVFRDGLGGGTGEELESEGFRAIAESVAAAESSMGEIL